MGKLLGQGRGDKSRLSRNGAISAFLLICWLTDTIQCSQSTFNATLGQQNKCLANLFKSETEK